MHVSGKEKRMGKRRKKNFKEPTAKQHAAFFDKFLCFVFVHCALKFKREATQAERSTAERHNKDPGAGSTNNEPVAA